MAVKFDLEIHQMDAVTAFLQGDLTEEIYMEQPDGFAEGSNKVCHLKKSLYGLKQASRIWNAKLDAALLKYGLTRSKYDPCIYYNVQDSEMMFVAVYVDDLLIFCNNKNSIDHLKGELSGTFKMKDLGNAQFVLGMNITRDRKQGKLWIDQEHYINEMLLKFNLSDCNPVATPIDCNQKLSNEMCPQSEEDRKDMEMVPYQQAVGSILFAAQISRPDICYAVNFMSRFNNNPGKAHWTGVKRILRYLKGTSSWKLEFSQGGSTSLVGFCDADWASDLDSRRSTTGYIFKFQNGPISWNSKRQPTVALSTTEAEYMSMSSGIQEAMWLNGLRKELLREVNGQVTVYCDNKSAINLSETSTYHARTKHIDVRHHFIRDVVSQNEIQLTYVPTDEMIADVMTKGLPTTKHTKFTEALGMKMSKTKF